ncbi:MAG: Gx transporter family protein [Clostridiaceae bacterium]
MKKNHNVYKLVFIALLVAQALVLTWIERFIPLPIFALSVPGFKLGLANIFTMVALYTINPSSTLLMVVMRVVLAALLFSNLSAFLYSMAGGVLSFLVMYLLKIVFKDTFSKIGISVAGAFAHNLGQLLMAAAVLSNLRILTGLPMLTILAIPTGFFVGMTANFMLEHLGRTNIIKEINKHSKIKG